MKLRSVLFFAMLGLAGCSATWHNSSITDPAALKRQLAIDESYCTRVAIGAAPMPEIRTYEPSQQNYAVSGNIMTFGPNGLQTSYYSGSITPSPNEFSSGFSSGLSHGAALGATIKARQERDAILKGCMTNLGWSDSVEHTLETNLSPNANTPLPNRMIDQSGHLPTNLNRRAKPPKKPDDLSCSQWVEDIAVTIDSAHQNGLKRGEMDHTGQEYLTEMQASGKDRLIFAYVVSARYQIPRDQISSQDFPRYIQWECEKGWSGINLRKP